MNGRAERLEAQLAQTLRLQAVGQLAGGIAHDFNNLLTAMIGFCDLLLLRHRPGDQSFADVMQIRQNANRAASLVRQLLAYSRQQTLQPRVISLSEVLAELAHLLRRLIGGAIDLKLEHGRDLYPVLVDQGQVEQVVINLVVNARDAMPEGGTLTIRTANVDRCGTDAGGGRDAAAGRLCPHRDRRHRHRHCAGDHRPHLRAVLLDQAGGRRHRARSFHRLWHRQAERRACRHRQQAGRGHAPSPSICRAMPRVLPPRRRAARARRKTARDLTGAGTILLVEDEDAVRLFSARALRNKGYKVIEARSGEAALDIMGQDSEPIDLLITDVVMPRMDGPALVEKVRSRRPDMKVIFISGYAESAFRQQASDGTMLHFLAKPFSLKQLATKVKDVLEGDQAEARPWRSATVRVET